MDGVNDGDQNNYNVHKSRGFHDVDNHGNKKE